jgi:hypothetical protein
MRGLESIGNAHATLFLWYTRRSPCNVKKGSTCWIVSDTGATIWARPPVATTAQSPSSFWKRRTMPSMSDAKPYKMPDCSDSTVFLPITLRGSMSSTARNAAARPNNASIEISMPGAMAPPMNSPLAEMMSKLVPVPKSTTIVGPP